jgi:uncharacterized protein YkwD
MPSVARSLAVVLAGTILVSTVATAERYLVTEPLGGTAEDAIKLAGAGDAAPAPTPSQSADGVLKVDKTGVYLGTARGEVTLAGPDHPPAGATVTFTLYGAQQRAWTDATAPYAVRVDTRTLPNGEYRLAVETRWKGGMSTRVATLLVDNAADPARSAKPTPAVTPTTTPSKPRPVTTTATTTTTTTTKARRTTTTTKRTTKAASGSSSSNGSFTDEVVRLTNVERAGNGCGALAIDATLTKVAQAHSEDMADHDYFSHDSQDGRSPFDRMSNAGYRYSTAAENIAAGQSTPASVVEGWMNSAGHRANILNCSLKEIGVGYAVNSASTYRTYWTQDFGTPR